MKKLILVLVTITFSFNTFGAKSNPKLNRDMKGIAGTFKTLLPYLTSLEDYRDKKNEKEIKSALEDLVEQFDGIEKHLGQKKLNFKVSKRVIREHLEETIDNFDKHRSYSYKMAKSVPGLCIHCHAHDGKKPLFGSQYTRADFKNDFEFAEFNHMTRNYAEAIKYYDRFIEKNKKNPNFNASEALKRQLSLYVMSLNKPNKALDYLNQMKKTKGLDFFSQNDVKEWISGLQKISEKKKSLHIELSKEDLEGSIQNALNMISETETLITDEKDRVFYLVFERKLNDYLNDSDSDYDTPVILYWLAFVERKLNYNLFYSFADVLLRECMISYTKHPYAKKCYQEYKNQMVFSFTGSSGEHIPDDVRKELIELKQMIFTK